MRFIQRFKPRTSWADREESKGSARTRATDPIHSAYRMPASASRRGKSSVGRKSRRRRREIDQGEPIETLVADKVIYSLEEYGHCNAFAEEEAELVPAHMIDTIPYQQVRAEQFWPVIAMQI